MFAKDTITLGAGEETLEGQGVHVGAVRTAQEDSRARKFSSRAREGKTGKTNRHVEVRTRAAASRTTNARAE